MKKRFLLLLAGLLLGAGISVAGDPSDADERLRRLLPALLDRSFMVRLETVAGLKKIGTEKAADALASVALFDDVPSVREEAILALGRFDNPAIHHVFERALLDPNREVREAVIEAAVDIGGDDGARILSLALIDEHASIREEAVYALGVVGGEIAVGFLQQALSDENVAVRNAAEDVLFELEGTK